MRIFQSLAMGTALVATLSACAADTSRYPSLERRDAERMTGSASPVEPDIAPPPAPATPPTGLTERLAAIAAAAEDSHKTFQSRVAPARERVRRAAGAELGTLAWADAEVALSSLESARSDTMFALADLDELLATGTVAQAETGKPAGLPEISALREQITALVASEDAVLADVRAGLASSAD